VSGLWGSVSFASLSVIKADFQCDLSITGQGAKTRSAVHRQGHIPNPMSNPKVGETACAHQMFAEAVAGFERSDPQCQNGFIPDLMPTKG
jgi:hypothetical protein